MGKGTPLPVQFFQFCGAAIRIAAQKLINPLDLSGGAGVVSKTRRGSGGQDPKALGRFVGEALPPSQPGRLVNIAAVARMDAVALDEWQGLKHFKLFRGLCL